MRTDRLISRLAARMSTRQLDHLALADDVADRAEAVVSRLWTKLLRLIHRKPPPHSWELRAAANGIASELRQSVHADLQTSLHRLAKVGYQSAADVLSDTLPSPLTEALDDDIADLLFPPLDAQAIAGILAQPIAGRTWMQDLDGATKLATGNQIAGLLIQGFSQGKTPQQVAASIRPVVQGVQSTARRVARTYGMQITGSAAQQAHEQLGDMLIGYQIHAVLDQHTRPEHASRNGTIYYREPKSGQLGFGDMPHPPLEADGSTAWNCRCWLTPVLSPVQLIADNPIFADAAADVVPDPAVYSDWFARADERRRKLAVGVRRYSQVKQEVGSPGWERFIDPETGSLLSHAELADEKPSERHERVGKVRAMIGQRKHDARRTATYGFV